MHRHPGPAADARAGRGAQVQQVAGPRPAYSPDRERAEVAEHAPPVGPQVGRAKAHGRVEPADGRGAVGRFRSTLQQVRRHEHLGQHPHQVTTAARLAQRPLRHDLLGHRTGHQPTAPLHQLPKHRIHTPTLTPQGRLPQQPQPPPVQSPRTVDNPHAAPAMR
ncbi:hypothetical protein GCM10010169_44700 [Micromonospora fulviviridis]|nr:hypothetical protein GCM10010169_44700 [Micromonospora fulviviridis]